MQINIFKFVPLFIFSPLETTRVKHVNKVDKFDFLKASSEVYFINLKFNLYNPHNSFHIFWNFSSCHKWWIIKNANQCCLVGRITIFCQQAQFYAWISFIKSIFVHNIYFILSSFLANIKIFCVCIVYII